MISRETRFSENRDTSKPINRYITLEGTRYVLYSLEEDKKVIKGLTEKKYLEREVKQCDSIVDVLRERENFYEVIVGDQKQQIDALRELGKIHEEKSNELKTLVEANSKKERRRATGMNVLLVLACVFTLGLFAVVILKK